MINWEKTGLLDELKEEHHNNLIKLLNEGEKLLIHNNEINPCVSVLICPALRRIFDLINDEKDRQLTYIKRNIETVSEINSLVNVENIINELNDFTTVFLPVAQKYLNYLDAEAELLSLYCDNYVYGLCKELKIVK